MSGLGDLTRSGEFSTAVLAALPGTAVLVFDADLRCQLAAGQALERHRWDPARIEGRTLAEFAPEGVAETVEPHLRAALNGEIVRFDRLSLDGTAVYRSDVAPIRSGGDVVAAVVVSRDVTEARLASAAVAESERRYRLLAEHSTDVISRHTPDGTFLYASPATRELVGYEPEELVGTRAFAHHHPDDVVRELEDWKAVLASSEPRRIEYRFRRGDGSWTWLESTMRRVRDERTGSIEIIAVTRDITKRKHAERDAREAHERFEAAFRDAPIGKALVALDGKWQKVNRSLCAITGYSEQELLGMTFQDITHPDDLDADLEQVERLMSGEIRSYRIEKRYFHADGHVVWVALSVSLVRDEAGAPCYMIGQIEDISERKSQEQGRERMLEREREQVERLRHLDHLKDEFVSFVSHELRTPLTSIRGYVDLLLEDDDKLDQEQLHFLKTVDRNGERLNRLIEDLLEYFRIEGGRVELAAERVDMSVLLRQAADSAGPAAVRKQLALTARFPDSAPVMGDEGRLAQVIDNLISNAIKYTPEGGDIEVTLAASGGQVELTVSDTGIGIPEEERERLFERFFRASTATKASIPGTGLGLAITKALVEAHGGTIAAQPRDPGTSFVVSLPGALAPPQLDVPLAMPAAALPHAT